MKLALILLASFVVANPLPNPAAKADAAPVPVPAAEGQPDAEADVLERQWQFCMPYQLPTPEKCRKYCGGGRFAIVGNKCCCPGRW